MGQSTDGLVWWGMAVEDDSAAHEAINTAINGDGQEYLYGDGREWLTANGLLGKVEFVDHCSLDYPMYGLAAAGSVTRAYRGSPKVLGEEVRAHLSAVSDLLRAADLLGAVRPEDGFGWVLASWWA